MRKSQFSTALVLTMLLAFGSSTVRGEAHFGVLPTTVKTEDARNAWEQFKRQGLTSEHTPGPNMLRQFWNDDTRGEYQAWALVMAVMHDDHETAQKLWNFCKHYIPKQRAGLVPWLIRTDPGNAAGGNVGDADCDYAIALDIAARKWPDYRDDEGKSWADWATYYINRIYDTQRARATNPDSPNAISGKGFDRSHRAYARGADEHYYLHYGSYGYFRNWQDRTGNRNWTQAVDGLESVYDAEINLQKPTLAKYYGEAEENPHCWPPHQVRKDGSPASDMTAKYDSGWNMFNWGPGRIAARANHAYTNYGDAHAEKMLRFLADRFLAETQGDPAKIRTGYRMGAARGAGCQGWGDPNLWHIGHAAMAAMVDEKYRDMLDRMSAALKDADTQGDPQQNLAQAFYLLHLTGGMDFRIPQGGQGQ
jgi:hypothetical protein